MTAPAQHAAGLHADIASHRDHATALVAAYRDALAKLGGDEIAAFACVVGAAYSTLCHRRTAQVLAAAVQMLVEREGAAADKTDEQAMQTKCAAPQTADCQYPATHIAEIWTGKVLLVGDEPSPLLRRIPVCGECANDVPDLHRVRLAGGQR